MSACSRQRRRGGTTSLEMAFVLVPFLYMMLAVIDLGRYFFTVESAYLLAARVARDTWENQTQVNGFVWPEEVSATCRTPRTWSSQTPSTTYGYLPSPFLDPTQTKVCFNAYQTDTPTITVQVPFNIVTPGLGVIGVLAQPAATPACEWNRSFGRGNIAFYPGVAVCTDPSGGTNTVMVDVTVGYPTM